MKIVNIIVLLLFFYYFYSLLKKNTDNKENQHNKKENVESFKMFCDENIQNTNKIKDYIAKINSVSKAPQLKYPDFSVPYNFDDNLNYSVLYTNGVKDVNKRLKYEKKLIGGVRPEKFNLLKNNYNKDLQPFKKIPNYYYHYKNKNKCVKTVIEDELNECFENISSSKLIIKLLARWVNDEDKIYLNWSIPICNYISSILIYSKVINNKDKCINCEDLKLKTFTKYEIPYQNLTLKKDKGNGVYRQYKNIDRILCNYTTEELPKDKKYLFYVGLRFSDYKRISNLVEI